LSDQGAGRRNRREYVCRVLGGKKQSRRPYGDEIAIAKRLLAHDSIAIDQSSVGATVVADDELFAPALEDRVTT
jgi:hypothetical protein